jgi:hypothetical protein
LYLIPVVVVRPVIVFPEVEQVGQSVQVHAEFLSGVSTSTPLL